MNIGNNDDENFDMILMMRIVMIARVIAERRIRLWRGRRKRGEKEAE